MALADEFAKGMMSQLQGISEAFPSIDRNVLQKMVSPGGSLADTLGYNNPSELWGMTPEAFQQSMNMRSQIMKDTFQPVKDLTAISDLVSGNAETRQAMYQAVPHVFSAQMQEGLQGQRFAQDEKMEKEVRQPFEAKQKDLDRAFRLREQEIQSATSIRTANIHAGAMLQAARERNALEERRIEALMKAQSTQAAPYKDRFPANDKWYKMYGDKIQSYIDLNKSKKEKKTLLKNAEDKQNYLIAHLMQEAVTGLPYNTFRKIDKESTGFDSMWFGQGRDGRVGWYGVNWVPGTEGLPMNQRKIDKFNLVIPMDPSVYAPPPAKITKQSPEYYRAYQELYGNGD